MSINVSYFMVFTPPYEISVEVSAFCAASETRNRETLKSRCKNLATQS